LGCVVIFETGVETGDDVVEVGVVDEFAVLVCVVIFETGVETGDDVVAVVVDETGDDDVDESCVLVCVVIFETGDDVVNGIVVAVDETGDDVVDEIGVVDESAVLVCVVIFETGVIDGNCLDDELFNSSLDPRGDFSLSIFEFNIDIFSFCDVKGRFFSNLSVILLYITNIIYILVILY
jgi:hypothetical protein